MSTYLPENRAELWMDDLLLTGVTDEGGGSRFTLKAQANADWGNPVPIQVEVQRWMTDGAVASIQGHQNRTISFAVVMSADTSADLAAAERAMVKAARNAQTLRWVPAEGDPDAPASVFELWTVQVDHQFNLDNEHRLARMWQVTATAKPWVRAEALTTVAAVTAPGAPTSISVDTCSSLTNWTGSPNTPTLVGGAAIRESRPVAVAPVVATVSLTRTASQSVVGTPYLAINMTVVGAPSVLTVSVNGTAINKVSQVGTVYFYALPTGMTSFTTLAVVAQITVSYTPTTVSLTIDDIYRTDTVGSVGSRKQLTRTLEVGGSVPTSGSVQVASPSATALGNVLVYTAPDNGQGYASGLRQYHSIGNAVTADTTAVSGSHESFITSGTLVGVISYQIPAGVLPEANYVILARVKSTIATTITLNAVPFSGATVGDTIQTRVTWTTANTWVWAVIGATSYPLLPVPSTSAVGSGLLLGGAAITGTPTVTVDEVYLLDQTHGAVSLVNCGTTATILQLNAPDADPLRNRPSIYTGTLADGSDLLGVPGAQIISMGNHILDPDGAVLFTVTDNVDNAVVTGAFYRRGHTHPPVD